MFKKVVAVVSAVTMCLSLFSGCGERELVSSEITGEFGKGEISYPLQTDAEVTFWAYINPNLLKSCPNLNESAYAADLREQTGINVTFVSPAMGTEDESFALLFSSDDIPDIIGDGASKDVTGNGADGAIEEGFLFDMTDYIEDYAPNYYKVLKENPFFDRSAKSNSGRYWTFANMSHTVPYQGAIVRKDWLDDLGLPLPETIEEWYITLKAFKEKKGATAPFAYLNSTFFKSGVLESAYDTSTSFYLDGDTIKFGPLDASYKEFVKEMAKWYAEGLIDKNIASSDSKSLDAKFLNGETGMTIGYASSSIGRWMQSKKADSPMDISAVKFPVLNKGDEPAIYGGNITTYNDYASISANSQNKELAMRLLDYSFSEEGMLLHDYGREGVSYVMEDGKPKFTDVVLNNPDGLSISEALYYYSQQGPGWLQNDAYLQQIKLPQQFEATKIWEKDTSHQLPRFSIAGKENKEFTDIMLDVETYISETVLSVICGRLPISTLDEMDATLKSMNIERAIQIQQEAYNIFVK